MPLGNSLSASLIITTYHWYGAITLVLQSVLGQSVKPGQVIVADDGSSPETACAVEKVLRHSDLKWCHVWHDDKSVRQSRIKNLAVKYSEYPYLIFIDQDVVLHPYFIGDHLAMAEEGVFLQGKRALLPASFTETILREGYFRAPTFWTRGLKNRKNTFWFPSIGKLFSRPKSFQTSLRGCNLSLFKKDFFSVDGFDETFDQSWGREDSDICYRLFHSGVRVKNLWFSALQYHLHHNVTRNWQKERLDRELQENLKENRVKALKGFSQLTSEGAVIAASH